MIELKGSRIPRNRINKDKNLIIFSYNELDKLAEFIQEKIHNYHLRGRWFEPDEVKEILDEYLKERGNKNE